MDVQQRRVLWPALIIAGGCAANNSRDVAPVIVVDVPPAPSAQGAVAAPAPVTATDAGLATAVVEALPGDGGSEALGVGGLGLRRSDSDAGAGMGGLGRFHGGFGLGTWRSVDAGGLGHAPRVREGAAIVIGRLPPGIIQRIVRQNFGRFRMCYENGLRRDASLTGTVAARFEIDNTGAVGTVTDGGSTMSDPKVRDCVHRAFHMLSFPQPEAGTVKVVYPIVFSLVPRR